MNPGEWLRLQNQEVKENIFDFAKEHQVMDPKHGPFMVALVAIKINLILKMESNCWREMKAVKLGMNKTFAEDLKRQYNHFELYLNAVPNFKLTSFMDNKKLPTICNNYSYEFHLENQTRMVGGSSDCFPARMYWHYFNRLRKEKPHSYEMVSKYLKPGTPYYLLGIPRFLEF